MAPHGSSSHRHRLRRPRQPPPPPPPLSAHQSSTPRCLLVSLLLLLPLLIAHAHASASASSFTPGAEAAKQKGGLFHCAWQFETSHARCNMGVVDKTVRLDDGTRSQSGLIKCPCVSPAVGMDAAAVYPYTPPQPPPTHPKPDPQTHPPPPKPQHKTKPGAVRGLANLSEPPRVQTPRALPHRRGVLRADGKTLIGRGWG